VEVEVAFCDHRARDVEAERRRGGAQGDAGAGDERVQQHVAGAREDAAAAGGRVQPRLDERAAGLDAAGDLLVA
jgi:hypothetical protein